MTYVLLIIVITIFVFVASGIIRSSKRNQRNFRRSRRYNDKQVAIETHSKQLGKKLQERYGVSDKYPPDKIKATIKDSGWSGDRDCYGIAMYSDRADFIEYHRSIGEVCDYDAMRNEISECLSLPDNTFSTFEAIEAGALVTEYGTPVVESSIGNDGGGWSFWGSGDGGGSSSYDSSSSSSYDSGSSDSGSSSDGGGGGD
jgi:uncharacterized membrane protein YgcG